MNIYDIDQLLGCWIDYSQFSAHDFNLALVTKAQSYGYVIPEPKPTTVDEWVFEADEAYDYLNSICPHQYFFDIEDNSLFLRSEDE